MKLALFQERFDLLDDALVQAAAPDRLDRGQFSGLPSDLNSCGSSGQVV
jgi:hypothetical protein